MEEQLFQFFLKWSVRGLTFFSLAKWQKEFSRENLDPRAKVVIEEGERLGIKMERLSLLGREAELFRASKDSQEIIFKHLPIFNSYRRSRQVWVDDKWQAKQILAQNNLPAVPARLASTVSQALAAVEELGYPVVTKPRRGSRSQGVYIDIFNQKDLSCSFKKSRKLHPQILIESQVKGDDYRITLIGGEVRGVIKRVPANIIGDGQKTIKELAEEKNQNPLREEGRSATHQKIPIVNLPNHYLKKRGVKLTAVPEKGERVYLHHKVTLPAGADLIDVTKKIHPENGALFEEIARIFDTEVIGIDFKSPDISESYKKNQGKILELNSLPYLNMHHQPWRGRKIPIARYLWQRYLK